MTGEGWFFFCSILFSIFTPILFGIQQHCKTDKIYVPVLCSNTVLLKIIASKKRDIIRNVQEHSNEYQKSATLSRRKKK
jgi:hypothetical protein